ncbi:hypothetical protein MTY66_60450 (plasmid) [Mycolicibacterium sp. TY66]|uniref:hypothetical protein n=1 Tax=unclassified Mycolicibacterium TaxID=2636767 RepID=UPI001BB3F294|nr:MULTISPECIES: hypothetical protein [unclassified Mycolicibacterium]BCI84420.1 hypothetical protein MTY66_60450 [Mycolicibacterium sp. TY66]BCJ84651.1 hypothetical protein MTY81_60240 [Mycolicibacterium sp. TY81]
MTAIAVDRISPAFAADGEVNWPALLTEALTLPGQMGTTYCRFYSYSLLNQILLMMQGITEPCAPFSVWTKLGRIPQPGGARWVRHPRTIRKKDKTTGEEERVMVGSKLKRSTFPYSNTAGPDIEWPELPGWDWQRALAALDIEQEPFRLIDGNTQGYSYGRRVAVSPMAVYPLETGLHELGHVMLGHTTPATAAASSSAPDGAEPVCQGVREFQAESVAYLLAHEIGLTDWAPAESRAYIQDWLGNDEVTDRHIRAVFAAVDKILAAGRSVPADDEAESDSGRAAS